MYTYLTPSQLLNISCYIKTGLDYVHHVTICICVSLRVCLIKSIREREIQIYFGYFLTKYVFYCLLPGIFR